MNKISTLSLSFAFVGGFLGAGYISGQELYQFFGAFGIPGFIGLVLAITMLVVFNIIIAKIVRHTGSDMIDKTVVGSDNKFLLFGVGILETVVFFGTYIVMAAGAGALIQKLTGIYSSYIWGSFIFCAVISFISIKGITGLIKIFSAAVPILVALTLFVGAVTVIHNFDNGFNFEMSSHFNPLIPNWVLGSVTFASYNLLCAIGVLCPVGIRSKSIKSVTLGTILGGIFLIIVALSVLLSLAVLPEARNEALPMLEIAKSLSDGFMYVYAALLFIAMSGAALSSLIPTVTYISEYSKKANAHQSLLTFFLSAVAFVFSCFGFAGLVGTLFSSFGYISLIGLAGIVRHYLITRKK